MNRSIGIALFVLVVSAGTAWSYIPDLKTWTIYMNSLANQRERPMLSEYQAVQHDGTELFHTFALFRSYFSHQITAPESDIVYTSLHTGWKRRWRKGMIPPQDPRLPASPGDMVFSAQFQGVLHKLKKAGLDTTRNTTVVHNSERRSAVLYGTPGSHFVLLERESLRPLAVQQVAAAATTGDTEYRHHLWVYDYADSYRSPSKITLYQWAAITPVSTGPLSTALAWVLPGQRTSDTVLPAVQKDVWSRLHKPRRMTQSEIRALGIRSKRKDKGT